MSEELNVEANVAGAGESPVNSSTNSAVTEVEQKTVLSNDAKELAKDIAKTGMIRVYPDRISHDDWDFERIACALESLEDFGCLTVAKGDDGIFNVTAKLAEVVGDQETPKSKYAEKKAKRAKEGMERTRVSSFSLDDILAGLKNLKPAGLTGGDRTRKMGEVITAVDEEVSKVNEIIRKLSENFRRFEYDHDKLVMDVNTDGSCEVYFNFGWKRPEKRTVVKIMFPDPFPEENAESLVRKATADLTKHANLLCRLAGVQL